MKGAALVVMALLAATARAQDFDAARQRWMASPLGPTLERILPPAVEPRTLPEPGGPGATLVTRYCIQCHNLPSPAMHHAAKWPSIIERMAVRMRGKGNLGKVMTELMAGVEAPSADEQKALADYFARHAQAPIDPARVPELRQPSAESFRLACQQCHVLPDPRRYRAAEWPKVVARMQDHMEWMNRVVGSRPIPGEPQLRVEDINAFLARNASDAIRARGR